MKKINKILLYIMVMLLTITNLSSVSWAKTENAVADDYSEYEARVLHDLGVIDADIQFDQTMSRAEFADGCAMTIRICICAWTQQMIYIPHRKRETIYGATTVFSLRFMPMDLGI